ncbi:MAG: primosomal protein N' [Candidatus Omnitrophica bacterium]|nr:primosomal protein N' [Candidatus Omnitrophota bacterium]
MNIPGKDVFDYAVPRHLQSAAVPGVRVWIPFGTRRIVGLIVGVSDRTVVSRCRDIEAVIDETPLLSPALLAMTRWIAEYYCCSWGEAVEAAIPAPLKDGRTGLRARAGPPLPEPGNSRTFPRAELSLHQDDALAVIQPCVQQRRHAVFLLHGITASGKTEVYLQAMAAALAQGRTALMFVPEIALTPQTMDQFIARFGADAVAVIHSRLSAGEKFTQWQRIRSGQARVVIGARSAVFSPLERLGLIVVDEEHENTYKQEDVPRYHLVPAAIRRAEEAAAVVILGSATPSLESMYAARQDKITLIELPERVDGRELPSVQVIDMRQQRRVNGRPAIFSKPLEDAVRQCLGRREQSMIFLNRRGFATFISCRACGHVVQCAHCSIALVYHAASQQLRCHHCGFVQEKPQACPACAGDYLIYQGAGTEKVESELHRLFPEARIRRMDSDTVRRKNAHADVFYAFKNHEIDILVGTQMLAKGFDIPKVTVVGVVAADVALNLPDFRAAERTFGLITQVAGRAGRGKHPGRVLVQTYTPEHYAIQCAVHHDYAGFYAQEMAFRRQLLLPPYAHLAGITVRAKQESPAADAARSLFARAERCAGERARLLGPAPLPLVKLRGWYRWAILIKSERPEWLSSIVRESLAAWKRPSTVKISVDVDPLTLS